MPVILLRNALVGITTDPSKADLLLLTWECLTTQYENSLIATSYPTPIHCLYAGLHAASPLLIPDF